MSAYRAWILVPLGFAIVYPLVAGSVLVARWNDAIPEVFPVAPWALFCFAPNREVDFAVRVQAIDGRLLEPPEFFDDVVELTEDEKLSAYFTLQELGQLQSEQNTAEFAARRRNFERTFLRPLGHEVGYELVRREYDVLERWRTGRCEAVEPVGQFNTRDDAEAP